MKLFLSFVTLSISVATIPQPWVYNATSCKWQSTDDWAVGGNFVPSTAVNQLEMWQLDTVIVCDVIFDLAMNLQQLQIK